MTALRKIPLRSCVACHRKGAKGDMARVVRSADRTVLLDATGRAAGRGAYLCHDESCLDQALRTKRLARALRVELTDVDHAALRRMFAEQEGVIAHGGN